LQTKELPTLISQKDLELNWTMDESSGFSLFLNRMKLQNRPRFLVVDLEG
jgi:hypothetical protein